MCCEAYAGMYTYHCDRFAALLHFGEREFQCRGLSLGMLNAAVAPPFERVSQTCLREQVVVGSHLPFFGGRRVYSH
jgi:hypothetical protein